MESTTGTSIEAELEVPTPRANPVFVGHERAERELKHLGISGRMPHAILLAGPRGVGKATLAFRFARFLLARRASSEDRENGLAIDPDSGVFRRVASGGHADLLTVERAWDPRRRRVRGEIVVEDVRQIAGFFHLTAAEEGWRVVVVDGVDEMNRSAGNALLKVLEEPPQRALLLLVSHHPGRLLPTIRSRCRQLRLEALPQAVVAQLLELYRPRLVDRSAAERLAALAGGSIGQALELVDAGGLDLYRSLVALLSQAPRLDVSQLHNFVDKLTRTEADGAYRAAGELLSGLLARIAASAARGGVVAHDSDATGEDRVLHRLVARADAGRWAALREAIEGNFLRTELLNLDRRQTVLGALFAIEDLAR